MHLPSLFNLIFLLIHNFLAISLVLQFFGGIGKAAFNISYTCIIGKMFNDSVVFAFAAVKTSFGLGWLLGSIGGQWLFGLGGYYLPFVAMGALMLVVCIPTILFALPLQDDFKPATLSRERRQPS